jgi:hypothetical protein
MHWWSFRLDGNGGVQMKRMLSLAALLLSIPAIAQEKRGAQSQPIFHQGKPWQGCILVDRLLQFGDKVQLWDCPPRGQNTVSVESLGPVPHPKKRKFFARAWRWLVRR